LPSTWKKLTGKLIKEKPRKIQPFSGPNAPHSRLFADLGRFLFRFPFAPIVVGFFSLAWIHASPGISWASPPAAELAGTAEQWQTAEKIWEAHQSFAQKGDWGKAREELEKIYQWKLNQGIHNHYPFSIALIRESERSRRSEEAPDLLDYAGKMAPDYSQVPLARAHTLWSLDPFKGDGSFQGIGYWVQGQILSFKNFEEALPRIASLTFWILLSALFTLAVYAFYSLVRFRSFFAHHLTHIFRFELSPIPFALLSLLIAFAPFFLGLGWMSLFVFWLLLFASYGGRGHRIGVFILFLFLLVLPSGLRLYSSMVDAMTHNGIPEIVQANRGIWNVNLREDLLRLWQANPNDPDVLQALGLVEKRMGRYGEAEEHFSRWTQLEPDSAAALNNLANLYLVTHRVDQAIETYLMAIRLAPSRSEAVFNLGQAYLMKLRLREAEAEFDRAKQLKPAYVSLFTRISSSREPNRMAIDRTIDPWRLWRRVFAHRTGQDRSASEFWKMLWPGVPWEYSEGIGAGLIILLGLTLLLNRRAPRIRNCERCGRVFCSRCARSAVMGNQCLQCLHLFTGKASNDPSLLKRKRTQMARYQAQRQALPGKISLVLPGMGHILREHVIEGLAYLFILILFVTKIIFWEEWVPSPLGLVREPLLPWVVSLSFLFVIFYAFVQVRLSRIRTRGGKYHFRAA
jgi:tetratricopeptide (TPR) repeat protein